VACLLWLIRYAPSLGLGLPPLKGAANWSLAVTFSFAVFACFFAIVELYLHSPVYLLSVMVLVWIADIGAYFSGKAFGKRKLAPSISPGKSWEGAIGGGIAVLAIAAISIVLAEFRAMAAGYLRLQAAGPFRLGADLAGTAAGGRRIGDRRPV
jgi:phosphatidate cytidylyltransferase